MIHSRANGTAPTMEITGAKNGTSTPIVSNMMAIVMRRTTRFQLKAKKKKKNVNNFRQFGRLFQAKLNVVLF